LFYPKLIMDLISKHDGHIRENPVRETLIMAVDNSSIIGLNINTYRPKAALFNCLQRYRESPNFKRRT